MSTTYVLRKGSRISGVTASDIGNELERIDREFGDIRPSTVIAEAKPKKSPLHPVFQWDDSKAAEQYRLWQARSMVRSICIKVSDDTEPMQAFYHVTIEDEGAEGAYRSAAVVVSDPDLFGSALAGLRSKLAMSSRAVEDLERQLTNSKPRSPKRTKRVRAAKVAIKTAVREIGALA